MKAKYMTPAITVLNEDGSINWNGQEMLYEHLIQGGIDGILILGSIGEFFALSMSQKKELVSFAVRCVRNRTKLIVGTTSMIFDEIIELSEYALGAGADAVMVIPPYYFWLNQESIETYYDRIAERVLGDIYLYNFPDRTGYDIAPSTILNLRRKHKNIIGLKDTLAGVDHTRQVIDLVKPEFPEFEIYSGFDDNFAHNVLAGGDGCIGGLSNVVPELCHAWVVAFEDNNLEEVSHIQKKVDDLMRIYLVGMPFVPYIKKAIELKGLEIPVYASIPLPSVTSEQEDKLCQIMKESGII